MPLWVSVQSPNRSKKHKHQCSISRENPVYGTARVLFAYRDLNRLGDPAAIRASKSLVQKQNLDRGWGGDLNNSDAPSLSGVEETAMAMEALLPLVGSDSDVSDAVQDGVQWLIDAVEEHRHVVPSPIGICCAKLWYYDELHPLALTVSALGAASNRQGGTSTLRSNNSFDSPVNAS